jgi:predicted acylesterase/phospholipase RssA
MTVMKALILSGGGARGAYEAGAALALLQHERFDIICGTSIGAINGAFIAQDDAEQLERLWRSIASSKVIRLAPEIDALAKVASDLRHLSESPLTRRAALIVQLAQDYAKVDSPGKLTHLLGALSSQPFIDVLGPRVRYASLKRTLVVAVTNLMRGRPEAFYYFAGQGADEDTKYFAEREPFSHPMTESNYLDAVGASSAIPGAFSPVTITDKACEACLYVDGGVTGNAPINHAIHAGADDVTVIHMDRPDLRPPNWQISSIGDIAMISHDIMQQRMIERDLRLAATINEAVMAGRAPSKRYITIQTISPETPIGLSVLDFNKQDRIDAAIEQGKRDAERFIARRKADMHGPGREIR